jgi:Domain of unknown function (DUF4440)
VTDEVLAGERELWAAISERRFDDLRGLLAPDFLSVEEGAATTADELLAAVEGLSLEEYVLDDFEVTHASAGVAIVGYLVRERVTAAGQTSERVMTAVSIWTGGGPWRLSLHYEVPREALRR